MLHQHGSSRHGYSLRVVDARTRSEIEEIVKSTFDLNLVGIGKDGICLQYTGINVTDVKSVNNTRLSSVYCAQRQQISRKISKSDYICRQITHFPKKLVDFKNNERYPELNEVFLFHGTTEEAACSIASLGFSTQYSRYNALYGKGIYFAEKFMKADQYTDNRMNRALPDTELTVLLCRVVLGNLYRCHKNDAQRWLRPPCLTCKEKYCSCWLDSKYDSVLGTGHGMLFREFVVYDGAQCYPQYLIKYKRVYD